MKFESRFSLYEHVNIDGDTKTKFTITGFSFRDTRSCLCEVSWFSNGEAKTAWIEESRMEKAE